MGVFDNMKKQTQITLQMFLIVLTMMTIILLIPHLLIGVIIGATAMWHYYKFPEQWQRILKRKKGKK